MSKRFAALINEVSRELQDIELKNWTAAELAVQLEDAIREASEYKPYIVKETFEVEARTGTASSVTANKLVDSAGQFLSTDVDKEIFNKTDNTWAVVTAYDDANTLSLSKDIMASGESYKMFNKGCHDSRQINVEDITDYIGEHHGVIEVEYPAMDLPRNKRNFKVEGDILTIDLDDEPSDTSGSDADKEVFIWFTKRHRVSQLTDLAGAIDLEAGYAAGLKAIHVDSLQNDGTFAEDTEFTIAGCRGTYRVTADATIASGECDLAIYPGLESAIIDDAVVTIIGSTLNSELERLVVELTAARAGRSKASKYLGQVGVGGTNTAKEFDSWGEKKLAVVLGKLHSMRNKRPPKTKLTYSKT